MFTFKNEAGEIVQLQTDANGKLTYGKGITNCNDSDVYLFEQIHMSNFRVYNRLMKYLFVTESKVITYESPENVQPSKPDEQLAFFYQYTT